MKESAIEKKIGEYAASRDVTCDKFVTPNVRGAQDRVLTTDWGVTGFLEIKKPDGPIHPKQLRRYRRMRRRGIPCAIVDNVADGTAFINSLCNYRLTDFNEPGDRFIDKLFDD